MEQAKKFKTKPYNHQLVCLNDYGRREYFALLAEMGTGKSWIIVNNAADLWSSHDLDAIIIFAPNGVHYNWTLEEIPKHMPDYVRYRVAAWSPDMNKKEKKTMEDLYQPDSSELRILTMNWEALNTEAGLKCAKRFCMNARRLMIVGDESQNIKNPTAGRTKALMKLKPLSAYRRIMSGSAIVNSPFDAFSQFRFLHEDILETDSYYAFKAEYAEMLPPTHGLMAHIVKKKTKMTAADQQALRFRMEELERKIISNGRAELLEAFSKIRMAYDNDDIDLIPELQQEMRAVFSPEPNPKKTAVLQIMAGIDNIIGTQLRKVANAMNPKRLPQVVQKSKTGQKMYKNLDKLNALIAPHSFRVLKKDCLDLPEKIYKTAYFRLTKEQREIYDKVESEYRLMFQGNETVISKLSVGMKLAQITSGYFLHPDQEEPVRIPGGSPKLELLKERVVAATENGQKVIVWARFQVQIDDIVRTLRHEGLEVVQYDGRIGRQERLANLDAFKNGTADVFVGNQKAGGTGITIVESHNVVYFSNDFNAGDRWQSEDRAHRIGQKEDVLYTDLIAIDTIDGAIVGALVEKKNISEAVLAFGGKLAQNNLAAT